MLITLEENIHDVLETVTPKILSYTPQLYTESESYPWGIVPHATGVLIKRRNAYFLLTSGHCIEEKGKVYKFGIVVKEKLYFFQENKFIHYDSQNDLGIIKLSEESVAICKEHYQFLEENQLYKQHIIEKAPKYFIVGYPCSLSKLNRQKTILTVEPFPYLTVPKDISIYGIRKEDPYKRILLSYHKDKASFFFDDKIHSSPSPYGLSGCGLWYIPSFKITDMNNIPFGLIGVMTNFDEYLKHSLICATRIDEALKVTDPIAMYLTS